MNWCSYRAVLAQDTFGARRPIVRSLGNILYKFPWSQHICLSAAKLCQWQTKKAFVTFFIILQLTLCTLLCLLANMHVRLLSLWKHLKKNWTIFMHFNFVCSIWCTAYLKRMVLHCGMPFIVYVWLGSQHMPENALHGQSTGRARPAVA